MKEELFFAYLAGFIDADGSIGIVTTAKHKRYVIQVVGTNCNIVPLQMLKEKFGGKIRTRNWKNKNWRTGYEWKLTALKAKAVIEKLLPYLRIKNRQAELAIEAQNLKSQFSAVYMRWHPEKKVERDKKLQKIKDKCVKLNKRGVHD